MDTLSLLTHGLSNVLTNPTTMLWCVIGVSVGTLVGALPGIGAVTAMALLLPITYGLEPANALLLLVGIYLGGMYGGRISSILLNVPGDASSVVSAFDGHPLAKQGRAGFALTMSALASFVGGMIGFVGLVALSGLLAQAAIVFGPAEYFVLVLFVLLATGSVSNAAPGRAATAVAFGLLVSTIGLDPVTGVDRFTWGQQDLWGGVELVAIAVGIFGVSEVLLRLSSKATPTKSQPVAFRDLFPPLRSMLRYAPSMSRGGLIGFLVGVLPGAGASIATFMSYGAEKSIARDKSKFGHGDPRGLAAPEASDNASAGGALIPTLSLGIPGSAAGALILGGLIMAGVQPGPLLFETSPTLVWTVIAGVLVANVLLLALNTVFVPAFVLAIRAAEPYLTTMIACLCLFGVYSLRLSFVDVAAMIGFGLVGYIMRIAGYPLAGLLLGVILGPLLEQNMRTALISSQGDVSTFWSSPVTVALLIASLLALVFAVGAPIRRRLRRPSVQHDEPTSTATLT